MPSATLLTAVLLLQSAAPVGNTDAARSEAPISAHTLARETVTDFLAQWRSAWLASASERGDTVRTDDWKTFAFATRGLPTDAPPDSVLATRIVAVHCHLDGGADLVTVLPFARRMQMIGTRESAHGVCPMWRVRPGSSESDEATDPDAALTPVWRSHVAHARLALVARLDTLSEAAPADDFIAGQRVRFTLALGDTARSSIAVAACRGTPWWCTALAGYAAHVSHQASQADSLFAVAESQMPPDVRCRWQDASVLLSPSARTEYAALGCDDRARIAMRLWWLADPLYTTPGNERLAEHRARLMAILLHSALEQDERYDWRHARGGGALREALVRYGWPSFAWWPGTRTDTSHTSYLARIGAASTRPYATFEYERNRVHLVPSWAAIADPYGAEPTDLSVAVPPQNPRSAWWPSEHVRLDRPLCELADEQVAVLRRQRTVLIAAAAPLACQIAPADAGGSMTGALVVSPEPGESTMLAHTPGAVDKTLRLAGEFVARPVVLSLEAVPRGASTGPAMRMRMGVTPPASLAVMKTGSLAISAPLLFAAEASDVPPRDADGAIARMLGSVRLAGRRAVGVYWEAYNVAPSDSLTVRVRVERVKDVGPFRKLAGALGLVGEARATAVQWREGAIAPTDNSINGAKEVPIRPRAVVLDISTLAAGDYWIQIEVQRPGGAALTSRRLIEVVSR